MANKTNPSEQYAVVSTASDEFLMPFDEAVAFLRVMCSAQRVMRDWNGPAPYKFQRNSNHINGTLTVLTPEQLAIMHLEDGEGK